MSEFEYNDDVIQCTGNDYDSSFETDSEKHKKKLAKDVLAPQASSSAGNVVRIKDVKNYAQEEYLREAKRQERYSAPALDAYSRHKKLINDYFLCYKGQAEKLRRDISRDRTDADVLRDNHRFIWDDIDVSQLSWEERLAKKYYDKLFKEYCITDLRMFKQKKIAFRWRTEREVIAGKGQFSCGEKQCKEDNGLRSWEVNFAYVEQGGKKNALVKVRLCESCSRKLNHDKQRREVTKRPRSKDSSKHSDESRDNDRKRKRSKKSPRKSHSQKKNRKESRSNDSPSESSEEEIHVAVLEEKRFEDDNPWLKPAPQEEEPNLDDEFDAFLDDMLL